MIIDAQRLKSMDFMRNIYFTSNGSEENGSANETVLNWANGSDLNGSSDVNGSDGSIKGKKLASF